MPPQQLTRSTIDPEEWYPAEVVGDLLSVKEQTICRWCRQGAIPGKKMRKRHRWHVQGKDVLKKLDEWEVRDDGSLRGEG